MATNKMIFAGFGGQGVLSMGIAFAYGAMDENKEATFLPSYGPEMRGGTANCHTIVSDTQVASPLIATADILVVMNKPSLAKFVDKVKSGGYIFVNSDVCDLKVERDDVNVIYAPVLSKAIELGNAKISNTIMLGVIQKHCAVLSDENMWKGLDHLFEAKPKLIPMNHDAYMAGKGM